MGRKSNEQKILDGEAKVESPVTGTTTPPADVKPTGTTTPPPTNTTTKKDDIVEIKREDLDRMMKIMESQGRDISLLLKTADKSRIAKELNKDGENLIKQCKVRTWDDTDKLIMGWKLVTNKCEVVMGKWIEEQICTIIFEDGETLTIPLLEFYRKTLKKVEADIISRTDEYDVNNNKIVILKLQFPTGKTILLNSVFAN
tara:strand:- start:1255 stop:1854 length:600 start_codon:yes stop_codon:yes gene_type:complete